MRKFWFYLLAVILVGGAAAAIVIATKDSKSHKDDSSSDSAVPSATKTVAKQACQVFTLADAKQLLGDNAKGGQNPEPTSSNDLKVTTCTYTQDQGANAPVASRKSATLLVRVPLTTKGATSNQNEFGPLKPTGVQEVAGYGDSAYWDAEHGQLNILKNNNWYILSFGPSTPGDRTLDQAKQMADQIVTKL